MITAIQASFIPVLLVVTICQPGARGVDPAAAQGLPVLVHLLEGNDAGAISDAIEAAKETVGPAPVAKVLINALRSEDSTVRTNAAAALEGLPESVAEVVPALTTALQDKDASVRANAAGSLAGIARKTIPANRKEQGGILFKESVAPIAAALNDTDESVRSNAAVALGALGHLAKSAESSLRKALKDDAALVRVNAASALWKISEKNKDAVLPVLREGLASDESFVRVSSIWSLKEMGAAAADVQEELRKALSDKDEFVRRTAASALGNLGPHASDAMPDLLKALKDKSVNVRMLAAEAICRIDKDRSMPAIEIFSRIMKDKDVDFMIRIRAVELIAECAYRDDAIQAIEQLLSKKNDPLVRPVAAETLKKLKNRD